MHIKLTQLTKKKKKRRSIQLNLSRKFTSQITVLQGCSASTGPNIYDVLCCKQLKPFTASVYQKSRKFNYADCIFKTALSLTSKHGISMYLLNWNILLLKSNGNRWTA